MTEAWPRQLLGGSGWTLSTEHEMGFSLTPPAHVPLSAHYFLLQI